MSNAVRCDDEYVDASARVKRDSKSQDGEDRYQLRGAVRRLSQSEIETVAKSPVQVDIADSLRCSVANFQLLGRPVGLYPPIDNEDQEVPEEVDDDSGGDDAMIETVDEDTLQEIHMRCNHRDVNEIKRMAKDGVLDLQWNENLENELKDFHCESCSAVRLKNQTKRQRRESPRASRPLQIIRMDTIPCPMSVDEEDEFQKLLLKLPKRSVPVAA